jgi:hypothetical protein
VVAVAWRKIVAGLRDADDRLSRLQFLPGQAVIEVPFEVKRGHPRVMGVIEPLGGTEFAPGDAGKRLVHCFSRSAHAFIFVRNLRIGSGCLHVNAAFATPEGTAAAYDFDPRTAAKNSAKTRYNKKGRLRSQARLGRVFFVEGN